MLRSLLPMAVAAALGVVAPAIASQPTFEGVPPFGLDVRFFGAAKVGKPLRLLVAMSGSYPAGTPMKGWIVLPAGVDLVSGELSRSAVVTDGLSKTWDIVVRPRRKGAHRIVASFVGVVSERERDEGDFVLVLEAGTATDGGVSRRTRSEKVVGGRRFRYGDHFLVPIEGPEAFLENDILSSGQKPRMITSTAATCDACGKDAPAEVDFVVFIDKAGRLLDARALRLPAAAPAVVAARNALAQWTFQPARLGRRSVADWQVVKVFVHRPPGR